MSNTWTYISDLDVSQIYEKLKEQAPDPSSVVPALNNAATGAAGTAVSNVVTYPLDLIVTRLQVQSKKPKSERKYDGVIDAIRKIYETEGGLPGFYPGLAHDTFQSVCDSFLFFLAWNVVWGIRNKLPATKSKVLQAIDGLGIGVVAGAFVKALTCPIQNVVTRKQAEDDGRDRSVQEIVDEIYSDKGVAGFWSGYSAALVLTLNPSVTFALDSFLRSVFNLVNPTSLQTFLLGAAGKSTAAFVMYPAKMANSRAQTSSSSSEEEDEETTDGEKSKQKKEEMPENVVSAIPFIYRKEGLDALYAGVWGDVTKGFFSHGLTMLVKQKIPGLLFQLYYLLSSLLQRQSKMKA